MMIRHLSRLLAVALIAFAPLPALAQQVAAHGVPIGKGPGVVGFGVATAGASGTVFLGKGTTTDPAFVTLGGDGTVNSSGTLALDSEIHCLAAMTSAADKIAYYTGSGTCALGDFPSAERTYLTTPSSANLRGVLNDETGTGLAYFQGGALGTPSSGTLTSATGLPISTGVSGLGTGIATALGVNTGSAGAPVLFNGAGGTPASLTLTNATGLPVAGITASTGTALGVGSIELGHATDTTIARSGAGAITVEGVAVPTISSTDTLSNKTLASPIATGSADVQQALKWSGDISPTQIVANTNDYAPTGFSTATTLRLSTDASRNITGLAGGAGGRVIVIHNVGAFSIVLTNQDAASTAANRFLFGGDMTLAADTSVTIKYDATSSRWRAITSPGAGGGGGGGVSSVTVAAGTGISTSGTCTITTSGTCTVSEADQYRQNDLLMCANQAKALAAYQRILATFCDGYKASDGVTGGTVTNGTVNTTTSGFAGPTTTTTRISGGTPTTPNFGGTAANINDNSTGTSITTSALGSLGSSTVAQRIVGQIDYGSNKTITKIEVVGISLSTATDSGEAFYTSTDGTNWTIYGTTLGTINTSPQTLNKTGSTTARYIALVAAATGWGSITMTVQDLNGYQDVGNNMTLVTTAQTADATVSSGRVLMEVDLIDTPTLNTDLTAEVTCNGGSNYSTGTLSSIGKGQAGRTVVETADTSCGANTGTSFGARIKTLNGKVTNVYKTTVTVH